MFTDGRQRTFNNDMENDLCCYFFGVRRLWEMDLEAPSEPHRPSRRTRRSLPRR